MRDKNEPIYMISVAARMLHVHPQTLRVYEREGLIMPKRSGRQRLYSEDDIEKIALILRLSRELGVNRSGVDIILRMRHRLELLQGEVQEMMQFLEDEMRHDFQIKIKKIFLEE
ncbi:MAG: MerR family transcriptional regulator [Nitrospirae bacterium]|nr:MerR family transcriptional regulator [Nitrospirota bacterium]